MRLLKWTVLISVVMGGCTLTDENPKWNPPVEYPA